MATTTNYGWETPDDTDLVKDGAAAMRNLGQSIDTTFAELKGGTSGQMLTKASNTDNDYAWVTPEIGDITAVVADAPLTGGGTTGSVNIGIQDGTTTQKGAVQLEDSTASTSTVKAATPNSVKTAYDLANAALPKSVATTAGDILYRNGSAITRLPIGTAGQVLKVNSGATAPEWSAATGGGGMTVIASGSLSGSALSLTSIPGTYKNLQLVLRNFNNSGAGGGMSWTVNSITSYTTLQMTSSGTSGYGMQSYSTVNGSNVPTMFDAFLSGNNGLTLDIFDYADTTSNKVAQNLAKYTANVSGSPGQITTVSSGINSTAAITSLTVTLSAGSFSSGTYILYGVN